MTRANSDQLKHTPWFAKAGAACSIVPISRFVGPNIFALKGGGYGCLFSLTGLDEEGLTDLELESRVRSIEGALRGLPEGSCLYQYTRVMSGFELPRQKTYASEVTEAFASDRLDYLGEECGVPPYRPSLVPHLGAVSGKGLREEASGERHRHV
jgi:type IV secretion system protein VirB4